MVIVEFLGPIKKANIEVYISNLQELQAILKQDNEVSSWLESCAVAINDSMVNSLDIRLKSGDKITLLPPVCGG